ncbi:regulator of nonsense transcripts 3B [Tribolium madens]|uniref:regulator of nonsense transcripts 3B n=1 Tax=Tribolium madens TaxID=41895 RepID=UPI001CF7262F|nr:regulator of nonsense transcripts 3B [Tribolium madens]
MALPESSESSEKKQSDSKGPDKKEKLLTKVVIRRLPPSMDQETFLNQISPVPSYDYFYMVKGDASLGENSFSRAYINFVNPNDIYDFKEKFDNYVFLDSAGHEYAAVVEFAAFQKIPKRRNKVRVDPKVGTIESDPYYLEFVEMINKPPEPDEKPEYSYQITTENKNETSTPLLEYVKNKRAEKMRIREERREERKRKEYERKKFREDERRKRYEEKSPVKNKSQFTKVVSPKEKSVDNKEAEKREGEDKSAEDKTPEKEDPEKHEKPTPASYYNKNREKKYDDRKKDPKNKYPPKKDYMDKREYKSRRDDYKDYKERDYRQKYDDYKKEETKVYQKKVKKYTEKREERKIEAQKRLEQQQENTAKPEENVKSEQQPKESPSKKEVILPTNETSQETSAKSTEKSKSTKESDAQSQKRIRNKDRPTIAIYRPGMLSKRKQNEGESEHKENKKE